MREVWGSIPRPVKSAQCRQRFAIAAVTLRSCVAQALSHRDGSCVAQALSRRDGSCVAQALSRRDGSCVAQALSRRDGSCVAQALSRRAPPLLTRSIHSFFNFLNSNSLVSKKRNSNLLTLKKRNANSNS